MMELVKNMTNTILVQLSPGEKTRFLELLWELYSRDVNNNNQLKDVPKTLSSSRNFLSFVLISKINSFLKIFLAFFLKWSTN